MKSLKVKDIGLTSEELLKLITPIRKEDGTIDHESPIIINHDRLRNIISPLELDKSSKNRTHIITVKMVDIINEIGFNQYLPDKFKPVLAPIIAMTIINDEKFLEAIK